MIDNHASDLLPVTSDQCCSCKSTTILAVSGVPFAFFGNLRLHHSVDVRHGLHDVSVVCILAYFLVFRLAQR